MSEQNRVEADYIKLPYQGKKEPLNQVTAISTQPPRSSDRVAIEQEKTRSQLAHKLLLLFSGTIVLSLIIMVGLLFVPLFFYPNDNTVKLMEKNIELAAKNPELAKTNQALIEKSIESSQDRRTMFKDIVTFLITSQVGLLGSALGFYFGQQSSQSSKE